MKKLLLSIVVLLVAFVGYSQNQCNASFTWSQTPTNFYPFQVTAMNTSTFTGTPSNYYFTSYTMNWGDNTGTSYIYVSGPTTHNYANAGTYVAIMTMTVVDSLTQAVYCTSTYMDTITTVVAPCNTTISTTNNGGGNYTFTANNSGGSGYSYNWNFGDGNTSSTSGQSATHQYNSTGTYTVTLTVVGGGMTCTAITTVSYSNGSSVNCNLLSANFSHNSSGLTTYFYNSSTNAGNTNPILTNSSYWNFGDNTTSSTNYPVHTYAASGYYLVTLVNNWVDSFSGSNVYCTKTDTQTIYVPNNAPNYITGSIYWDSTLNITSTSFKVWLITFDTMTNIIDAIDSVTTSGIQGQVAYTFNNVPAGVYRTKAAVMLNSPGVSQMAPTYSYGSTYWGTANVINHNGGATAYKDIIMQAGSSATGPGFVSGNVTQGAGKGTNTGVPNLLIILRNTSNQMLKFTYTDINGDYSFSNIPIGTYTIYPENMPQITTPSSSMTVTSSATTYTAVDFIKNSHTIKPKTLGINDLESSYTNIVFPNPTKDVVNIKWNSNSSEKAQVSILDITGRVLFQNTESTTRTTAINVASMTVGMYFLKIVTPNFQQTEKIFIQK